MHNAVGSCCRDKKASTTTTGTPTPSRSQSEFINKAWAPTQYSTMLCRETSVRSLASNTCAIWTTCFVILAFCTCEPSASWPASLGSNTQRENQALRAAATCLKSF
eukprot:4307784-Amphidinium_carterae.1